MAEPLSFVGFGYNFLKDCILGIRKRFRKLTPEQRLAYREKWKSKFEEELSRCRRDNLRPDVIIHDVKRPHQYPGTGSGKGISPWFKAYFIGMYHGGLEIALTVNELSYDDQYGGWYITDDLSIDHRTAFLVGRIPFEQIEYVEFDGDEYYNYPHIFCHFTLRGEPYESLRYCIERMMPHTKYLEELASYKDVQLSSQKAGTRPFKPLAEQ